MYERMELESLFVSSKDAWYPPEALDVLVQKYPNLRHWTSGNWSFPLERARGRAACVEFKSSGEVKIERFEEAESLRKYLDVEKADASLPEPGRRLFLLEGVNNDSRGVLASELDVDPNVWARHSWIPPLDITWDPSRSIGTKFGLPSLYDANQAFHINYSQLVYLNLTEQDFNLRCAENGRRVSSSRVDGQFDNVGAVIRKLSFWGRNRNNGGWDGTTPWPKGNGFADETQLCS